MLTFASVWPGIDKNISLLSSELKHGKWKNTSREEDYYLYPQPAIFYDRSVCEIKICALIILDCDL